MTCVQIGSIRINAFKNDQKNKIKMVPVAIVTNQNPRKGAKTIFTPVKISQVREMMQN